MINNRGCYNPEQLERDVLKGREQITLEDILVCDIPLKDKYWFVCHKVATPDQNRQIAITVAKMVLHIYENRYPDDNRPRKAIEAAKGYLNGTISIEELRARRAFAAFVAAIADDTAYPAAYAADDTAFVAAYASKDSTLKTALLDYLIEFCKKLEPTSY